MATLTFVQFLEALPQEEIKLSAEEVRRMRERLGNKTLQMGHLQQDGTMLVPVDCIVEAVRSVEHSNITEAVEVLKSEQMVSMLQSVETLVKRVGEARKRKLEHLVEKFQSESDDAKAHRQWKDIEKTIFGVEFRDWPTYTMF